MSDLVCDDCGTINSDRLDWCGLCGESLSEERARRRSKQLLVSLGVALVVTFFLMVVPGIFVEVQFFHEGGEGSGLGAWWSTWRSVATPKFWGVWSGLYFIGYFLGKLWNPREGISHGNVWSVAMGGYVRRGANVGVVLLPAIVVGNLWAAVFSLTFAPNRQS